MGIKDSITRAIHGAISDAAERESQDRLKEIRAMVSAAPEPDVLIGHLPQPTDWKEREDGFGSAPLWNEDAICEAIRMHVRADREGRQPTVLDEGVQVPRRSGYGWVGLDIDEIEGRG